MRIFAISARFSLTLRSTGLALCACLCALACGSGDHTTVPELDAGADAEAEIHSGVNVCPRFDGTLVMPQRIAPEESSLITVSASDPDAPDSQLTFSWSAPSGRFSASDESVTSYRCDRVGVEQLTVSARDRRGCASELKIDVECIAN